MHSDKLDDCTKVSFRDRLFFWGQVPPGATYNARVVGANGSPCNLVLDLSTWRTDESMALGLVTKAYRDKCERICEVDWAPFPRRITLVWSKPGEPDARVARCVESWRACFPDYQVELWTPTN
jgi:hypothetical protein